MVTHCAILEGEPVTAYAYYAPNRRWRNGSLDFKDIFGNPNGTAEFLEATCTVHYGDNNYVDISFANATHQLFTPPYSNHS